MSPSKLEKDITILENKIFQLNKEYEILSSMFLKSEEVVKNILLAKNSGMKLKDAETMVYGYPKSSAGSSNKYSGIYPIKKDHELYNQANKLLKDLKIAGMKLLKENIGIATDLITTSIKIANSVAAMVQLIAPLSFNVPAAISLLLLIIDAINQLIKRATEIIEILGPLKQLIFVIDITSVIGIASSVVSSSVNALTNAANTAAANVSSANDALKNQAVSTATGIASGAATVATTTAAVDAAKALSNLQLPNIPIIGTPEFNKYYDSILLPIDVAVVALIGFLDVITGFELVITFLLGQLKSASHNASPTQSATFSQFPSTFDELKDPKNINKYTSLLNNIPGMSQSHSINSSPITVTFSSSSYVYDVLLSDGTLLSNLDDNQFESIKEKYNVIFDPSNSQ